MEIDKCYKSRFSPISPVPRLLVHASTISIALGKMYTVFLFFLFFVYMFWLPCCQREEHFCFSVVFLLSLQICCKYIQVQSPWHAPLSKAFSFLLSFTLFLAFSPKKSWILHRVFPAAPRYCCPRAKGKPWQEEGKRSGLDGDCAAVVDSIKAK